MKFNLSNCGAIGDVFIECNGITLITGKNGSGKTTIVKSIVSLISSLKFFNNNITHDVKKYIYNKLAPLYDDIFSLFGNIFTIVYENSSVENKTNNNVLLSKYPLGVKLWKNNLPFDNWQDSIPFLKELLNEHNQNYAFLKESIYSKNKSKIMNRFLPIIEKRIELIPSTIQQITDYLSDENFPNNYLFESTRSLLNSTFSNQLIPYNRVNARPFIGIEENNAYLRYDHNSQLITNINPSSFDFQCFYIEDGNAIDKIDSRRTKNTSIKYTLLKPSFYSLTEQLLNSLSLNQDTILRMESSEKFSNIISLINNVWPHTLSKRNGVTINSDTGLSVSNEASGAKVFIILKSLLEKGLINENTLLIFDEPENHLHPDWQNKFAEIICHISKYLNAKVICITHSPSLLLAFDVYSNILDYKSNFNCYFGDIANGKSFFENVSDRISVAHDKLNEPYVWMDLQDK